MERRQQEGCGAEGRARAGRGCGSCARTRVREVALSEKLDQATGHRAGSLGTAGTQRSQRQAQPHRTPSRPELPRLESKVLTAGLGLSLASASPEPGALAWGLGRSSSGSRPPSAGSVCEHDTQGPGPGHAAGLRGPLAPEPEDRRRTPGERASLRSMAAASASPPWRAGVPLPCPQPVPPGHSPRRQRGRGGSPGEVLVVKNGCPRKTEPPLPVSCVD